MPTPKESCMSFIIRSIVTNAPPPYHFDYSSENTQLELSFDRAVMVIKRRYDEKNNSLASISSMHRIHTSSCRHSNRPLSTTCSKSSRGLKMELSINMKSSKIVPFNGHPTSP